MGVVNFQHKIRDRELQLMHPQLCGLGLRRQAMAGAEIEQDVGGLADTNWPAFRNGGANGGVPFPVSIIFIIALMPLPLRATSV